MLNENIQILDNRVRKLHAKASEEYVHVLFHYDEMDWDGWVPVEYRRLAISIVDEPTCQNTPSA